MKKNLKIILILTVTLVTMVITITNLFIKKYEKESVSLKANAAIPQKAISVPKEETKAAAEEAIEEESPVSSTGPLAY